MKDSTSLWGTARESVSVASEAHKDKQIILLKKTISTQEEYINGLLRSAKKSLVSGAFRLLDYFRPGRDNHM